MTEANNVVVGNEKMAEMLEQLRKSFDEMESQRECLPDNNSLLEDINQHFSNIMKSLHEKFNELEAKERAFEEKKTEHQTSLAEREAIVTAKEQDIWDRLQDLRDAATSSITEAYMKYKASLENKVSTSADNVPNAPIPAPEENFPINKSSWADAMTGKVKPRLQLKQLCEQMDAKGLVKYISDNRKLLSTIRDELPLALKCACDPAHLVLNALEASQNQSQCSQQAKDNNLQVLHRTCLLLMESAAPMLGLAEPGGDQPLSSEIQQRAKVIADEWKTKLAEVSLDASDGYSLEALAFLQFLATFSISSDFSEDELCKLLIAVSRHRRQASELCRALRLAHKAQDVIGALSSKGRQIDAVYFSHAFKLMEMFPLVPLLKQYLDDMNKTIAHTNAAGAEKESANQELGALKAVVRCIEEYKLEEEYPADDLRKRILQIERAKADNKRKADINLFPMKKHWADGRCTSRRTPIAVDSRPYVPDRYPYVPDRYPPYAAPPHFVPAVHVPYGHPANAPMPYHYPGERAPPPYGASSNFVSSMSPSVQTTPGNYGNYTSSEMQQPASSNYGNYMGSSVPFSHQSYM